MTENEARQAVQEIVAVRGDYEAAHAMEDVLHLDFIRWIARTGTSEQRAVASVVLSTRHIGFQRVCA